MQSCRMQEENEMRTGTWCRRFHVYMALQNRMHMFQNYIWSFTVNKITEKVELYLPNTQLETRKGFFVDVTVLTQQLYITRSLPPCSLSVTKSDYQCFQILACES